MKRVLRILIIILLLTRIFTFSNKLPEGEKVQISGRVQREVIAYEYYQKLVVHNYEIFIEKFPRITYGDKIVVQGFVEDGELKNAILVDHIQSGGIYSIRKTILKNIQTSLPVKDAALVSGILLGSKSLLTEKFTNQLIDSGTIHVVVASGTNVTLTASFLISMLVILIKRKYAIPIALIGVWGYVMLSGFDPPLVRAAIMGSIAFSAQLLGRVSDSINALTLSVIAMIIINPIWLSDVGFQLSFIATLSLILFESYLNRKLHFVPSVVRQDLSTSLAAQIGVSPLLFYYFGRIQLISPIVNMLVLWTIPPIMIIGFLVSVISLIVPQINVLFMLVMPFTQVFIVITNLFS